MFRDVDVVIGCLDNREARLWVNRCCWRVGTPWIDGGIQEINGVVKVFAPPDGSCYECAMTENDYRLINLRYSCPLLAARGFAGGQGPHGAHHLVDDRRAADPRGSEADPGLPVEAGAALIYNGVANKFYTTRFQRREDCMSHETYPDPIELPLSAHVHSGDDLLRAACRETGHALTSQAASNWIATWWSPSTANRAAPVDR